MLLSCCSEDLHPVKSEVNSLLVNNKYHTICQRPSIFRDVCPIPPARKGQWENQGSVLVLILNSDSEFFCFMNRSFCDFFQKICNIFSVEKYVVKTQHRWNWTISGFINFMVTVHQGTVLKDRVELMFALSCRVYYQGWAAYFFTFIYIIFVII